MISTRCRGAVSLRQLVRGAASSAAGSATGSATAAGSAAPPPRVFNFKCTQCGKCCTGKGGRVRVNGREREALQRALRVSAEQLQAEYLTKDPESSDEAEAEAEAPWLIRQTHDDSQCVFLDGTKCSVYQARPTQCRTFPWWPQHLISDYDWQLAARHCEGITVAADSNGGADASAGAYELADVLPETIVYDIHRSGENFTYDELHEMLRDLSEVDPSFVDEYARELRDKFHRRVVFRDDHVTVLDTFLDGAPPTRCFVFNDRLYLVQTEMQLASDGNTLNPRTLVLDVHQAMSCALSWLASRKSAQWKIAVLGSGGGSLVRHIDHTHGHAVVAIDAVEPNARVNDVAKRFFGLDGVPHLRLHEQFGEDFVAQQLEDTGVYDLVFIDVEAGSPGDGILAPPLSMLTKPFLAGVGALLSDVGIVAINVITEDDHALRQAESCVLEGLSQADDATTSFYHVTLPKNTVIFAVRSAPTIETLQGLVDVNSDYGNHRLRPLSELFQDK